MIYTTYLHDTCYFYIESEDAYYVQLIEKNDENTENTENAKNKDKIVLQKCPNSEIQPLISLLKSKSEIVQIISHYLQEIHSLPKRLEKVEVAIKLFDFLVKYVAFVHKHPGFKAALRKKLPELGNNSEFSALKYSQLIFSKTLGINAKVYEIIALNTTTAHLRPLPTIQKIDDQLSSLSLSTINTPFTSLVKRDNVSASKYGQPFHVFKEGCPHKCHNCPLHTPIDYELYDAPYLSFPNWEHRPRWLKEDDIILSRREIDLLLDKNTVALHYWGQQCEFVFNSHEKLLLKNSQQYEATAIFHTTKKSQRGTRTLLYS